MYNRDFEFYKENFSKILIEDMYLHMYNVQQQNQQTRFTWLEVIIEWQTSDCAILLLLPGKYETCLFISFHFLVVGPFVNNFTLQLLL